MGDNLSEQDKFHIQVLLEEYRALRTEIIQCMQNRNSILTFGSAILGATVSATALSAKALNDLAILMICILVVPLLSLCTFNSWIAETVRMVRAAVYIKEHIETKINGYLGETLLWESYIRVPSGAECPVKIEVKQFKVDDLEQIFYLFTGITCVSFLSAVAYIFMGSTLNLIFKLLLLMLTMIAAAIIYILFRRTFVEKVKIVVKYLRA